MSVQIWVLTVPRLARPRFLDFRPRSIVAPSDKIPMRIKVKINMHLASLYRVSVACHMYSCIPLCSDIIGAKINRVICPRSPPAVSAV